MIYKRLEQGGFAWPKVGDGVMRLSRVQFEALFAGRGGSENSPGDCFPDASGGGSTHRDRPFRLRQNDSDRFVNMGFWGWLG